MTASVTSRSAGVLEPHLPRKRQMVEPPTYAGARLATVAKVRERRGDEDLHAPLPPGRRIVVRPYRPTGRDAAEFRAADGAMPRPVPLLPRDVPHHCELGSSGSAMSSASSTIQPPRPPSVEPSNSPPMSPPPPPNHPALNEVGAPSYASRSPSSTTTAGSPWEPAERSVAGGSGGRRSSRMARAATWHSSPRRRRAAHGRDRQEHRCTPTPLAPPDTGGRLHRSHRARRPSAPLVVPDAVRHRRARTVRPEAAASSRDRGPPPRHRNAIRVVGARREPSSTRPPTEQPAARGGRTSPRYSRCRRSNSTQPHTRSAPRRPRRTRSPRLLSPRAGTRTAAKRTRRPLRAPAAASGPGVAGRSDLERPSRCTT